MSSTLAAAAKANSLISSDTIKLEPTVAEINMDLCEWCGKCNDMCAYNAHEKTEFNGKEIAEVNLSLCKGCGACSTVCPNDAIDIIGFTNQEIESMIDAFVRDVEMEAVKGDMAVTSEDTKDNNFKRVQALPDIGKRILKSLESEPKAIPQIAEETDLPTADVVYYLMSLRKYGFIADTDEINDDEYYLYQLKR